MRNDRIEKLLTERFDRLEEKVDELRTSTIPNLRERLNAVETEAKTEGRIQGRVWGSIAIVISAISTAIAYFKN